MRTIAGDIPVRKRTQKTPLQPGFREGSDRVCGRVSYLLLQTLRSTDTRLPCFAATGREPRKDGELIIKALQHINLLELQGT